MKARLARSSASRTRGRFDLPVGNPRNSSSVLAPSKEGISASPATRSPESLQVYRDAASPANSAYTSRALDRAFSDATVFLSRTA
jgi:hypothetical protein